MDALRPFCPSYLINAIRTSRAQLTAFAPGKLVPEPKPNVSFFPSTSAGPDSCQGSLEGCRTGRSHD